MATIRQPKEDMYLKSRACVFWFAGLFFASLAGWWLLTSVVIRDFWDSQYTMKYQSLKACVEKMPHHPLWLVMGSSRVNNGVCPRVLAGEMEKENAPVVFNFGFSGADLFRQFICLRRIVEDGIKPDRVGIELVGVQLVNTYTIFTDEAPMVIRARRNELDDHRKYSFTPGNINKWWYEPRICPIFKYGTDIPFQSLSLKFPMLRSLGVGKKPPYDEWGWFVMQPEHIPPDVQLQLNAKARDPFKASFTGKFEVSALQRGLVERILDFCRLHKIDVFLLRTPESKYFQEIYTPVANAAIDAYFKELQARHGLQFIDGRQWAGEDEFSDSHHLNAGGAENFTRRLSAEMHRNAGHDRNEP